MKMDQNGHDLTHAQASLALPLHFTCAQQLFPPDRQKRLAKIMDITEQFD
jgi:hypothetical protein